MNTIDLTPLYRSSIGFDRLASLLDSAFSIDSKAQDYPPYDIEVIGDNQYSISIAVSGFNRDELDITLEKGELTVKGKKSESEEHKYLYHGIASRSFTRKFSLAEFVQVTDAQFNNGLLIISLVKEVPEEMRPRKISIDDSSSVIEHQAEEEAAE